MEAEARQLHRTGAWASVMLLLMVIAAPVFALVWALVASVGLRAIELPADRSITYALEDWCFVEGRGDLTATASGCGS